MGKHLMTSVQQAELQGQVLRVIEGCRVKYDLSPGALFDFLVCFAWGYARRESGSSHAAIVNSMRALCESNELAYQRATSPRLPFRDGGS